MSANALVYDEPTAVLRLAKILHKEAVIVTNINTDLVRSRSANLRDELHTDIVNLEYERIDEIAWTVVSDSIGRDVLDDATSGMSIEDRVDVVKEEYGHLKRVRKRALDTLLRIEEGDEIENGEVAESIRRHYGTYVTLESGPKVVRRLLQDQGIDPESGIVEMDGVVEQLQKNLASSKGNVGLEDELAKAERVRNLLRELLEMEATEKKEPVRQIPAPIAPEGAEESSGTHEIGPAHTDDNGDPVDEVLSDDGVIVTVNSRGLTELQRRTITTIERHLGHGIDFALISDKTCMRVDPEDGNRGIDCMSSLATTPTAKTEPRYQVSYAGDGLYVIEVADGLYRLVGPEDYPPAPEGAPEGIGIPSPIAHRQRDLALMDMCDRDIVGALALVRHPGNAREWHRACPARATRNPFSVPHCDDAWIPIYEMGDCNYSILGYEDEDGSWVEVKTIYRTLGIRHCWAEGQRPQQYGPDSFVVAKRGCDDVGPYATDPALLGRVLDGESLYVINVDYVGRESDGADLREKMLADIDELSADRDDSLFALTESGCDEAQIQDLIESYEAKAHMREMALELLWVIAPHEERSLATLSSDDDIIRSSIREFVDLFNSYYSPYFRGGCGPAAARMILEDAGVDVAATLARTEELCPDPIGEYLHSDAAEMRSLLKRLLEIEKAERIAAEEEAERRRMELRPGNRLHVLRGPLQGHDVLVKAVGPHGDFAIIELEMMGRRLEVKIAAEDLRHS